MTLAKERMGMGILGDPDPAGRRQEPLGTSAVGGGSEVIPAS